MKKLLVLPLVLAAVFVFAPVSAEAATVTTNMTTTAASVVPQFRNRNRGNQAQVRIVTRNVRVGRRTYRETYRVTTRRNGKVTTQLISRTRIR